MVFTSWRDAAMYGRLGHERRIQTRQVSVIEIKVAFDLAPFRREMDEIIQKQIPFATALALTWTAKDAEAELRGDLPSQFTVRSGWVKNRIRTRAATKNRLEAEVGSRDNFMKLQAIGGQKSPAGVIPAGARPTPEATTPRSKWPSRLIARSKHYKILMVHGEPFRGPIERRNGAKTGLFRRIGKERHKITMMYAFADKVRVPARWPLASTVTEVVRKRWSVNAARALQRALQSRRR